MELVDTLDLGSSAARCESSSLSARTFKKLLKFEKLFLIFNNGQIEVSIFVVENFCIMNVEEFIPTKRFQLIEKANISCIAPSNIALIKYWGKKNVQIPSNPSISFTLNNCKTTTTITFQKKTFKGFSFKVFLDGNLKDSFNLKIENFFNRIICYCPYLEFYDMRINTNNTFPHSSGIASSASGFSALAMCIVQFELLLYENISANYINRKASFLARLGSGSACRSIDGGLVVWGQHKDIKQSSDLFGIKFPYDVHPVFNDYQDTILIVDKNEKQVSSSIGHNLMYNHPFASQRFNQANKNLSQLIPVLKSGDLFKFIKIIESEALTLHAMMMCSDPYFILMKPNTINIINEIWDFRNSTQIPVCFTLDAGANVHVLYPKSNALEVNKFIDNNLAKYCQDGQFINDHVGNGAGRI